jgi:hypothetical protein
MLFMYAVSYILKKHFHWTSLSVLLSNLYVTKSQRLSNEHEYKSKYSVKKFNDGLGIVCFWTGNVKRGWIKLCNEELHHIRHFLLFLCSVCLKTPPISRIIQRVSIGRLVNNEFEKRVGGKQSWPEFNLQFLHTFGRTNGNHKNKKNSHGSRVLRQRFEVKSIQMLRRLFPD